MNLDMSTFVQLFAMATTIGGVGYMVGGINMKVDNLSKKVDEIQEQLKRKQR